MTLEDLEYSSDGRWYIEVRSWHRREELDKLLEGGWEPFAVSEANIGTDIWLRKWIPNC